MENKRWTVDLYLNVYAAVMRGAFRFAVFPKQLITFNPMQYVVLRGNQDDFEMFSSGADGETGKSPVVTDEQFKQMSEYLQKTNNPALLPIQIAYYTGLRLGEVCGLTWQDIDLEGKYLTVRRSICYNNTRKAMTIGPTKRKKIRTVDFGDTLTSILTQAKKEQQKNRKQYGELYHQKAYIVANHSLSRKNYGILPTMFEKAKSDHAKTWTNPIPILE